MFQANGAPRKQRPPRLVGVWPHGLLLLRTFMCVSRWASAVTSLRCNPGNGSAGSHGGFRCNFLRNPQIVSKGATPLSIPLAIRALNPHPCQQPAPHHKSLLCDLVPQHGSDFKSVACFKTLGFLLLNSDTFAHSGCESLFRNITFKYFLLFCGCLSTFFHTDS